MALGLTFLCVKFDKFPRQIYKIEFVMARTSFNRLNSLGMCLIISVAFDNSCEQPILLLVPRRFEL